MSKFDMPKNLKSDNKPIIINYFVYEKPIEKKIEKENIVMPIKEEAIDNNPVKPQVYDEKPKEEVMIPTVEEVASEVFDRETDEHFLVNPEIVDIIEPFATRPTLRRGSTGASVTALQNYLSQLGYFNATPNGQFGPITEQSVRNFQRDNGLTADGVVGSGTWARIEQAIQGNTSNRPTLRRGSTGTNVTTLQNYLSRLGLFNTTPNGQFGPITEQAVRDFQRNNGLNVEGIVGPNTWNLIEERVEALPPTTTGGRPTLRLGSTGLRVIELQLMLQVLGFFTGTPDGNFGPQTQTAVTNFQRANGLPADGVVGASTWSKLDSNLSASGPDITAANRTTIRQGSRGSDVTTLQQILNVLGYLTANPDGNFGPLTHSAVVNFQRAHGLSADGIVGRNTWNALYHAIAITPSEELPTIREGATGDYVVILQEKLKLLGYFAGTVDGSFGSVTTAAVREFQLNNRLVADGVVGSATWDALFSATAIPTPPGLEGEGRPTIRLGSTGPDVSFLQQELKTLLYYNGPVNGIFDSATQVAVKAYQDVNRLTPDGVVGRSTWYSLISLYPPKVTC